MSIDSGDIDVCIGCMENFDCADLNKDGFCDECWGVTCPECFAEMEGFDICPECRHCD